MSDLSFLMVPGVVDDVPEQRWGFIWSEMDPWYDCVLLLFDLPWYIDSKTRYLRFNKDRGGFAVFGP